MPRIAWIEDTEADGQLAECFATAQFLSRSLGLPARMLDIYRTMLPFVKAHFPSSKSSQFQRCAHDAITASRVVCLFIMALALLVGQVNAASTLYEHAIDNSGYILCRSSPPSTATSCTAFSPVTFTFPDTPSPSTDGLLTVSLEAGSDVNQTGEFVRVSIEGVFSVDMFIGTQSSPEPEFPGGSEGVTIPLDALAVAAADGQIQITFDLNGTGASSIFFDQVSLSYLYRSCDFSTEPGIERCFGGIGNQCEGFPLPFFRDENTCLVQGWMSVGSILHDKCCIETNNTGAFCANPRTLRCLGAFREAASNVRCGRFWSYTFGPYPDGNAGDATDQDLRAPVGTRVRLNQQNFCPSGKCRVNVRGRTIIGLDNCGIYCECE